MPSFHDPHKNLVRSGAAFLKQIGINLSLTFKSIDVIHVFDALFPQNAIPIVLWKIRHRSRKPVVFVDWDDWWGRGGILDLNLRGVYRTTIPFLTFLEEKIPSLADGVTVTNETLRNRAVAVGVNPHSLFVIPNGTDINYNNSFSICEARRRLNLPLDAVIYCFHTRRGILSPQMIINVPRVNKNIILLAHKIVRDSFPNAFLLLLGENSKAVLDYARSLGLDKNVLSIDFQPADVYKLYLSASDFFLLPVEDLPFERARFPQRLMDYLAAGRPVITTALPEIRKIVGDCGFFIREYDEKDLAGRMLEAITNPVLCQKKGKAAIEKVKKQASWMSVSRQLEEVYYNHLL